MPGLGFKSYVQFAPEAIFGVAPASMTNKLEIVSWNVTPQVGVIQDPSLYSAQSRRGLFQGGIIYRGTFVVRCNYEGLLELFRGVSGTYPAPTLVESGVRDHFFTEGATLKSYTIQAVLGDVPTGKAFQLTGAKFINVTVRGTAGVGNDAMLMAEFTVLAKDMASNVTPTGSPTFPTVFPVLFSQAYVVDDGTSEGGASQLAVAGTISGGTLFTRTSGSNTTDQIVNGSTVTGTGLNASSATTISGVTATTCTLSATATNGATTLTFTAPVRVRSFEFSIENPHTEDRFFLSSQNIDEPVRSDFLVCRFRMQQEFGTQTQFDTARAFTQGSPALKFRHPTTIGAASKREMELHANVANLVEYSNPVEGYGILIASATWEATYDSVDTSAYQIRFRNTETALP